MNDPKETIIHNKSFLEEFIADLSQWDAISMENPNAENTDFQQALIDAGYTYSYNKAIPILRGVSGITSTISSSILIWMILRSHKGLSTTQHRMLLVLCIFDILSSLSYSTFNVTAPSDVDYLVWNASGSQASCTVQGFLNGLGAFGGLFYNSSLNLYYLAVIKYEKSDEYIRAKIEPFLHGVPITLTLAYNIALLIKKHYNDNGFGFCILPVHYPPHCVGYDLDEVRDGFEIPCGRGLEGAFITFLSGMALQVIPVLIMLISLGMIYRTVSKQEKKLSRYGVGALRANIQQSANNTTAQHDASQQSSRWARMRTYFSAMTSSLRMSAWGSSMEQTKNKPAIITRSNDTRSQSRAVMHKAFGYSLAWFLSYGCTMIGVIFQVAGQGYPPILRYIAAIFVPLQGLFNLLIYMLPKVMSAKKSNTKRGGGGKNMSWCQAFSIAFWSKGKGTKTVGPPATRLKNTNLRGNLDRARYTKNDTNKNSPQTTTRRPPQVDLRVPAVEEEEEKSEIPSSFHKIPDKKTSCSTYASSYAALSTTETRPILLQDDMSMKSLEKEYNLENADVSNIANNN